MKVTLSPSRVEGSIVAPPSKSMTHRALLLASLVEGKSSIKSPLVSDDTLATMNVLKQLGAQLEHIGDTVEVDGGHLSQTSQILDCNESGTTMRLITSICPLLNGSCTLTGGESLSKRPMKPLLKALEQLGVNHESNDGKPPITIHGEGVLPGGKVRIPGDISSQYISSLMIAAPLATSTINIHLTTPLESKPYVKMTRDAMLDYGVSVNSNENFGEIEINPSKYVPAEITVEGDWSSAAFFIAAGVLSGRVTVSNLKLSSSQADKAIVEILKSMNAHIESYEDKVTVQKSNLQAIKHDMRDCPDLFPVVSVLCASANGTSILTGLKRLRIKESDRVKSMANGLVKMGAEVNVSDDKMEINCKRLRGTTINPYNDHRIAMAFAVLSLIANGETIILDADCVSKSYPRFWEDLESLGVKIRRNNDV